MPNFLSSDECEELLALIDKVPTTPNCLSLKVMEAPEYILEKFQGLLAQVERETGIIADTNIVGNQSGDMECDCARRCGVSPHSKRLATVWETDGKSKGTQNFHIDAGPRLLFENADDSLNFWVAIRKPNRDKAGLTLIPSDALAIADSGFEDLGFRIGGCQLKNGRHVFESLDAEYPFVSDLDAISISPEMGPGDMLIMTSNVLHRTQDVSEGRVAISFRFDRSSNTLDIYDFVMCNLKIGTLKNKVGLLRVWHRLFPRVISLETYLQLRARSDEESAQPRPFDPSFWIFLSKLRLKWIWKKVRAKMSKSAAL